MCFPCSGGDEPLGDFSHGFLLFSLSLGAYSTSRMSSLLIQTSLETLTDTLRGVSARWFLPNNVGNEDYPLQSLPKATRTHLKCLSAAEMVIAGRMIEKGSCALMIHPYKPFIRHV